MNLSISGGIAASAAASYDPAARNAERQQKLDRLKQIDPALEAKMEKIGQAMEQARANGTDPKTAMQTIRSQFGDLTPTERAELKQVGLGGGRHGGGRPPGPPPVQNVSVGAMLQSRNGAGADPDGDGDNDGGSSEGQASAASQQLAALVAKKYAASALSTGSESSNSYAA